MRAWLLVAIVGGALLLACQRQEALEEGAGASASGPARAAHVSNRPPLDPTNIVSIAMGSKDHTTLVAAIEAADYVTSVAASGPLTVFAPTNEAFEKLPPGTVEELLKPEAGDDLRELLKYHVTTSSLAVSTFEDGQTLGMANGAKATIHRDGDVVSINDARIIASIPASNGMVHVIDAVLLPPARD